MASRRSTAGWLVAGFAFLASSIAGLGGASYSSALQVLKNGGFEEGTTAWQGIFSTSICSQPNTGSAAAGLTNAPGASMQQTVELGAGPMTVAGYMRLQSAQGSFDARVRVFWLNSEGAETAGPAMGLNGATSLWQTFTWSTAAPLDTVRVRILFSLISSSTTVLCLDDLSLDGSAPPTPTPIPTATPTSMPTSTETSTAVATSTATGIASSTPVPTATRPAPTATAQPASPSLVFSNGGFEDGTAGWQKFGGELRSVSSPRRSGSSAGVLSSTTSSTKWAYQVVAIDPAQAYELAGYIHGDDGVEATYLRISWYASADGSGQAIATDDTTTRASGGGVDFAYLTTGAKLPPANVRSARLRVMLAPSGAAPASVYFDDITFVASVPVAASLAVASTPAPDEPFEAPAAPDSPATREQPAPSGTRSIGSPTATPPSSETSTAVAEVALAQDVRVPTRTAVPPQPLGKPAGDDSGSPMPIYLALASFGLALIAAVLWSRRTRLT